MPIQILSPQLANQIAAGEVVERPASVIKELVENSLDAGATKIDIDIERGGSQLMRIRDNGKGIAKEELMLALSRHATSKVTSLEDLEQILSLGFRGEALASISSVSRLTLTSKPADQAEAWAAIAEGRDMQVSLQPAAHPDGTCVEVADLFFNTPARRRFLRSDKTEYQHIDEVVRRIALSRFDVQIKLTHNGALQRSYRVANQNNADARIQAICGRNFTEGSVYIQSDYQDIKVSGWLGLPQAARNQNDMQYCYINGRMMRDKLINHAIRQAYEDSLPSDMYPAYVLYLTIDPKQVDVNVHPAKHEVRFHQARLVHDFVYQTLHKALHESQQQIWQEQAQPLASVPTAEQNNSDDVFASSTDFERAQSPITEPLADKHSNYPNSQTSTGVELSGLATQLFPGQQRPTSFQQKHNNSYSVPAAKVQERMMENYAQLVAPVSVTENQTFTDTNEATTQTTTEWKLVDCIQQNWLVFTNQQSLYAANYQAVLQQAVCYKLFPQGQSAVTKPLLVPVSLKLTNSDKNLFDSQADWLKHLGFAWRWLKESTLVITQIPSILSNIDLANLFATWVEIVGKASNIEDVAIQQSFIRAVVKQIQHKADLNKTWLSSWQNQAPVEFNSWMANHCQQIDLNKLF
ncbi:DNA mismatch repair endonuclease MutL [Catenovulum sp. SX2]|uniref:DNA mismatch repair endonuclease MutL n=1 Tax=Catenovulum sp. SX2 TaxID=3398614 RepID=UPI003F82C0D9